MRVLVCGSRYWREQGPIWRELRQLPPGTTILHGNCKGADRIAGHCARMLGFDVEEYNADWSIGKKAGPIRNERMFREGHPDLVLAFHPDVGMSRGTVDTIERAKRHGVPYRVIER